MITSDENSYAKVRLQACRKSWFIVCGRYHQEEKVDTAVCMNSNYLNQIHNDEE